ncbi:reverse transcriptase domain-containing protein [Tanacetum coccineum]
MDDTRTMAQLLEAPTEGYEDAIVVPEITADNFGLKHGLLTLVQNKQFFGHDKEDPHAQIRYFNKIASTMKFPNVPNSLNSATGGNFLDKMPRDCLRIIESKSKVRNSAYQALAYQAPAPQTQGVSKTDFESYVKANDAVMQNMQSQMSNITDLLTKITNSNAASTSGSSSLPSNTVANPKGELKAITTRGGASYDGPQVPPPTSSLPKVVENEPEMTKDTMPPTNNGSTKDVQLLVVQFQPQVPNSKPVVAPVSAPMPNLKPSIPYPSRRNDERRREKANDQIEKFYEIYKDLSFEINLTDALILIPKFASTLKSLIGNKEKLSEIGRTPLNEHYSAVILNKLPEKLRDPGKFLIPCDFPGMDECLALADLGASINLMPLSVWKKLSLSVLTPTCMTLKLADCSISQPIGIAEDVDVKVGKFQFLADFVVVDFDTDPRVPLILRRSFLKTGCALIDVYEGELTLHVRKEAVTFNLDQTSRYSSNYDDMTANGIDVIEMACEEYSQEVLGFSDVIASGNPTPYYDPIVSTSSPTLTPFGDSDFLSRGSPMPSSLLKRIQLHRKFDHSSYDHKGDILLLKHFLNDDPNMTPSHHEIMAEIRKELKVCEAKTDKSSIDEPPEVKLKDLPTHLEYAFLEGDNKLPVIIAKDLSVEEKSALIKVLKSRKRAIAWKLSDIKGLPVILYSHNSYGRGLQTGGSTPKTGAVLGQRHEKHFRPIHYASKTLNEAKSHYTTTEKEMLAVVYAFEKFWSYFILNKSIVYTDHSALKYLFTKKDSKARLLRWVLLFQEFRFKVIDTKGAENLAADHLSRLENPYENMLDPKEINETFPLETLNMVTFRGDSSTPWFADYANYHAGNFIVKGMSS